MADYSDIKHAANDTDYIAKLNTLTDRAEGVATEVEQARVGQSDLPAKIGQLDSADTAAAETTAEVVAARDGELTLLAKLQALASAIGDVQTYLEGASDFNQDNVVDVKGLILKEINQALTVTAKSFFIYDTAKDDNPAWVNRETSLYNETLNTATRGATRPFPRLALLILQHDKLGIYDATDAALPMWAIFEASGTVTSAGKMLQVQNGAPTAVTAKNGYIFVCGSFITRIDLVLEKCMVWATTTGPYEFRGNLKQRNETNAFTRMETGNYIGHTASYDAKTVFLPGTPMNAARGMRTPTGVIGFFNSIALIKHDDTTENYTTGGRGVALNGFRAVVTSESWHTGVVKNIVANFARDYYYTATTHSGGVADVFLFGQGSKPAAFAKKVLAVGTLEALNLVRENAEEPEKGAVAYITSQFNTGFMRGAIKLCALADTTEETVLGIEHAINGDFATDTAWTKPAGVTISGGAAHFVSVASGSQLYQAFSVSGYFVIQFEISNYVGGAVGFTFHDGQTFPTKSSNGVYSISGYSAAPLRISVRCEGTTTLDIDNLSVRDGDRDRCVIGHGLSIHGSINKAAVASGAELVEYSGFSVANYMKQPYSPDLDFGTGDFYLFFWVVTPAVFSGIPILLRRYSAGDASTARISVYVDSSGSLFYQDGAANRDTGFDLPAARRSMIGFVRRSGVVYPYVNGVEGTSAADAADKTSANNAALYVGIDESLAYPAGGYVMSLLRMGAGGPSAEEVAAIYRAELPLFNEGAKCTLPGAGDSVQSLSYDDDSGLLHVGTDAGNAVFEGLVNVGGGAVGSVHAVGGGGGASVIGQGGTSTFTFPEIKARRELPAVPGGSGKGVYEQFDTVIGVSETDVYLPQGWRVISVSFGATGSNMSLVPMADYSMIADDFAEGIRFDVAPGAGTVGILAAREDY